MSYFTSDFNQFFKELAANNRKEWFDENRKRYEKSVKIPFEKFVLALIDGLKLDDPTLVVDAKAAIFRINRDIRFSKDKSPYKLNRSAAISKYGKKDSARPGIYIELGPEHVVIAGGAYQPEPAQLNALRNAIIENHKNFRSAIEQSEFKKYFGEIRGEKAKRISDKTQAEMALREPYLYNKQFYYWAELPPEWVTNDALIDEIIKIHRTSLDFRNFIEKALI